MMRNACALRYPASAHRCLLRRVGVRSRLTTMALSTSSIRLPSLTLAAVTMIDNGTPRPSTSRCRLLPFFPPIRRVWPDGFLCQRCFHHRAVDALPSPGYPLHLIVLGQACLPQRFEYSGLLPLQKPRVHRTRTTKALARQCLPLTASTQYVHDGLEHQAWRLWFATPATLADIFLARISAPLRQQRFNPLPELVRHGPCWQTLFLRLSRPSLASRFRPRRDGRTV